MFNLYYSLVLVNLIFNIFEGLTMDLWYYEQYGDDLKAGFKTSNVIYKGKSEFQEVVVLDTIAYGKMLLLDGLVMCTDKDEFVYHELISHVPALNHSKPEKIVVIGGGDGGTVRELLKHPEVKEIVLCEIDGIVIETCEKYFPQIASGLRDNRVKVNVGDGVAYMSQQEPGSIDMVLVDSTDPIGPGEGLFSREFYRNVARALKKDGLMACQSESPWHDAQVLSKIYNNVSAGFQNIYPYIGSIPTYPKGMWSWMMASNKNINVHDFDRARLKKLEASTNLQYINEELMTGVFAIPNFLKVKMKG